MPKTLKLAAVKRDPVLLARACKDLIANHARTREELMELLNCEGPDLAEVLKILGRKSDLQYSAGLISLKKPDVGKLSMRLFGNEWHRVGLVADTHLACQECRLEELNAQYDLFAREGITTVLHAGNMVDGFIQRINGASVICPSSDGQIQYTIDFYPRRPGITTHYITGDDHEGWWIKEGHNWGRDLEREAISQGRDDLKYIGHVEADVEFVTGTGSCVCKVQHPGEGSAYARSYKAQKQVEAFEGGEKPAILVQGHYHVSNYMNDRNIHVINMPGFKDQDVFSRKKRLRMEVGGAIMSFTQGEDGSVARFQVEFNRYFNRGYYRKYLTSDHRALQGHLVIKK